MRIVILGAGYAGLRAARYLGQHAPAHADVDLFDQNDYHQLVTEMHKVASNQASSDAVTFPIRALVPSSVRFHKARVEQIDVQACVVATSEGTVRYDRLLICLGAESQDYGIPGVREHTTTLQYLDSALRLKGRIRALFEQAMSHGAGEYTIAVVGGGLTGVELVSELADHLSEQEHRQKVPVGLVRLVLVQAAATILPEQDRELIDYATEALAHLGVQVFADTPVDAVLADGVRFKNGEVLHAQIIVWAGGVQGNRLVRASGLSVDPHGRLLVDATLQVQGQPQVFAAGDVAAAKNPQREGRICPPTAQLAVQAGLAAARNLKRVVQGLEPVNFQPRILGTTASLGRSIGIATLGHYRVVGQPAMTLKRLSLMRYLLSVGGLASVSHTPIAKWWSTIGTSVHEHLHV